jgi:hypothetical protein
VIDYEFQDVFILMRTIRPDSLALQREEVDGVLEMDIEQGVELFSGTRSNAEGTLYRTGAPEVRVRVSARDFVPSIDSYYLKLLLLAQQCLNGERKLLAI